MPVCMRQEVNSLNARVASVTCRLYLPLAGPAGRHLSPVVVCAHGLGRAAFHPQAVTNTVPTA